MLNHLLPRVFLGVSLAAFVLTGLSAAEEKATPKEVYSKVLQAHRVLSELGEQGLAAFDSMDSEFVWKDSYVFVNDCDQMTTVAHPLKPGLVGKNLRGLKCKKTGKLFFQKFCQVAQNPNGGWVEYYWPKPGHPDELFRKITFVIKVSGTPWIVGAGVYNDSIAIEDLQKTRF